MAIDNTCNRLTELEKRREIAANLGLRGDGGQLRQRLPNAQAFIVSEEEQFVLDDGPAQREAELVLLIRLLTEDIEGIDCSGATGSSKYPCAVTMRTLFAQNNPFLFINDNTKGSS